MLRAPRTAATLADVARAAGVSISTASRTLNTRAAKVAPATERRVQLAATQLGYATNRAAQAVVRGRTQTIGLLVDCYDSDYANPVAAGVFAAAARRNLMIIETITGGSPTRAAHAVAELRGQRSEALFVAGRRDPAEPEFGDLLAELGRFESEGGRVVMIGQPDVGFDSVGVDGAQAGRDMATALWDLGYREFSVFGDALSHSVSRERSEGFSARLRELGVDLTADRFVLSGFSWDGGYRAAGELLRRRSMPPAVFCTNDLTAIGAIRRLVEAGVRVGDEVAIAGCDDLPALRDLDPPLTTVRLPWTDVAEAAFALVEGPPVDEPRTITLAGHVVVRRSTPVFDPSRPLP